MIMSFFSDYPSFLKHFKTITIFALLFVCGCDQVHKYQRRFFALDTIIDAIICSRKDPSPLFDSLEKLISKTDSSLSISNPKSDIWKINHRQSPIVHLDSSTVSIIRFCKSECDSSGNLFDITVAPLKYLYGLESHQTVEHVPSQRELDSVRQFIGCNHLNVLDDSTIMIDSGVTVDLGGIAKGYLFNKIKSFFEKSGEEQYMVNLGGDLIAWGKKPDGSRWNVGIEHPRKKGSMIGSIAVSNTCVFTSGDNERFFIKDGVRYHHLFNPKTGMPSRKNQSSTVICDNPVLADISVKVAFLKDAPNAIDYLKSRNMAGVIVDSTGAVWASTQLKGTLKPDSGIAVIYR
jgi:thiamine biosynthesis lipoprotein